MNINKFFFLFFSFIVSFISCNPIISLQKNRVKKLGEDIVRYAQNGNYDPSLVPKDLVFIGKNTFWNIMEITEPVDSIHIMVHLGKTHDEKADYILDIGTHIGLRIKYDYSLNKFHILGYSGSVQKLSNTNLDKLSELSKYLRTLGKIRPKIGLENIIVKKSSKDSVLKGYEEQMFNRLGLFFEFKKDTLSTLYISKYSFETQGGIRPETSSENQIIEVYGQPNSVKDSFVFLNKNIRHVKVLEYDGIRFVLLKDKLMLIAI